MVTGEARVGRVAGEEVDAAWIDDERPRAIDDFGEHLGERQGGAGAQDGRDGSPSPRAMPLAVGEQEDEEEDPDEERLGRIDEGEQRVLDASW